MDSGVKVRQTGCDAYGQDGSGWWQRAQTTMEGGGGGDRYEGYDEELKGLWALCW